MDHDRILHIADLIAAVYSYHSGGGNAHIALDDGNIEDPHIDFCLAATERNEWGDPDAQIEAERRCLLALRDLSPDERATALTFYEEHTDG